MDLFTCFIDFFSFFQDETSCRNSFLQTVLQSDKSLGKYSGTGSRKFLDRLFEMSENNISDIYYWKNTKSNQPDESAHF